jgi:hypothetical protein
MRLIIWLLGVLLLAMPTWAQPVDALHSSPLDANTQKVAPSETNPLTLNYKSDKEHSASEAALGEFRVSLGSPVLTDDLELSSSRALIREGLAEPSRFFFPVADLEILSAAPRFALRKNMLPATVKQKEARILSSTLTLTATYLQDEFGRLDSSPSLIGARKRIGRWAVYGEIDGSQPTGTVFPAVPPLVNRETPQVLLNVLSSDRVIKPTLSETPSVESNEPPPFNNYYLEATYDFHSAVKGRVSYERSRQDILDTKENLQVEGIVKTGADTMIKAGFRNQTGAPEVKERRPTSNNRIWTEFILKF